jgi:hypothetical protein
MKLNYSRIEIPPPGENGQIRFESRHLFGFFFSGRRFYMEDAI